LPYNKFSKEELSQLISKLQTDSKARYQILTDVGIAGVGMAGAGAVATVTGTSIVPIGWGITALTGFVTVVAAPVGLVVGAAVVGGVATYSITQAVRFRAYQHGKRDQLIQQLIEMLRDMDYYQTKAQTTKADKTRFSLFLGEPVKLGLISPESAYELIQLVENGSITLFEAYRLVKDILQEFDLDNGNFRDKAA
jgi:hypothetical protein